MKHFNAVWTKTIHDNTNLSSLQASNAWWVIKYWQFHERQSSIISYFMFVYICSSPDSDNVCHDKKLCLFWTMKTWIMNLSKLVLFLILFVSAFSYLIYLVLQFEVLKYKDLQVQQSFKKQNKYATEVLVSQMSSWIIYRFTSYETLRSLLALTLLGKTDWA